MCTLLLWDESQITTTLQFSILNFRFVFFFFSSHQLENRPKIFGLQVFAPTNFPQFGKRRLLEVQEVMVVGNILSFNHV